MVGMCVFCCVLCFNINSYVENQRGEIRTYFKSTTGRVFGSRRNLIAVKLLRGYMTQQSSNVIVDCCLASFGQEPKWFHKQLALLGVHS